MRTIHPLLKLGAAAVILASTLLAAPSARAVTCTEYCNDEYDRCINEWQLPQSECDLDRRQCLRRC